MVFSFDKTNVSVISILPPNSIVFTSGLLTASFNSSSLVTVLTSSAKTAGINKKVHIKNGNPFFLVSLIEHKSSLDYNVRHQQETKRCEASFGFT